MNTNSPGYNTQTVLFIKEINQSRCEELEALHIAILYNITRLIPNKDNRNIVNTGLILNYSLPIE